MKKQYALSTIMIILALSGNLLFASEAERVYEMPNRLPFTKSKALSFLNQWFFTALNAPIHTWEFVNTVNLAYAWANDLIKVGEVDAVQKFKSDNKANFDKLNEKIQKFNSLSKGTVLSEFN
jgi:hypothetical protein